MKKHRNRLWQRVFVFALTFAMTFSSLGGASWSVFADELEEPGSEMGGGYYQGIGNDAGHFS